MFCLYKVIYESWVNLGNSKLENLQCVEDYGFRYILHVLHLASLSAQVVEFSITGKNYLRS